MRNLYLLTAIIVCSFLSNGQCIQNGDFENGITNNSYTFIASGDPYNITNCNVDTSNQTVFVPFTPLSTNAFNAYGATWTQSTPGNPVNDPTLLNASPQPISISVVNNGTRAIKLNRSTGSSDITSMSTTFQAQSTSISFSFNFIVQNSHQGHPELQSFFSARILDNNNNIVSTNEICITADNSNPIFTLTDIIGSNESVLYTDWRCAILNIPDNLLGEELRLEFLVSDCRQTAHFGTVYIDDITCDASCENPPLGFIELDPIQYNCPNEPFNVCGTFSEPLDSDLQSITLEIVQDSNIIQTLTNPQITGDVYCFTVNPYDFGITGDFEIFASADFEMSNNFILTLFDQSSVPGADITFSLVNPSESTVNGSILSWPDISDTYELEFVSDNTCCPGGAYMEGSYSTSLTNNQIDLDIVLGVLQNKCFRWRIRTEECGNWSEWCCLAYDSENEFPNADYGNLLGNVCYSGSGCVPTLHAIFTESGTIFEQREEWITAVNTIDDTAEVDYQAGEYVELQPGFNTVIGSVFLAHIDDCVIPTFVSKNLTSNNSSENQNNYFDEKNALVNYNGFTVYPNPTNGSITVQFEGSVNTFTLHDITGKQLMNVDSESSGEVQINLSNLAPGVYILSADGIPVQKIIKN